MKVIFPTLRGGAKGAEIFSISFCGGDLNKYTTSGIALKFSVGRCQIPIIIITLHSLEYS